MFFFFFFGFFGFFQDITVSEPFHQDVSSPRISAIPPQSLFRDSRTCRGIRQSSPRKISTEYAKRICISNLSHIMASMITIGNGVRIIVRKHIPMLTLSSESSHDRIGPGIFKNKTRRTFQLPTPGFRLPNPEFPLEKVMCMYTLASILQ